MPNVTQVPQAPAPRANTGSNVRVTLGAMRKGVTKTGKAALYLEDQEGFTVARLQLDIEAFAEGSASKYINQRDRTLAILNGLGVAEDTRVFPDRIPGLEVDLLREEETYNGEVRWNTRWISLPRELATEAFDL